MAKISINENTLRSTRLFVATPMYGGMANGLYFKSCLDLQTVCYKYGVDVKFSLIFNESLITRARNYLVDEFLRSPQYTHLLFIDADIEFNPMDVIALVALDKDIIGAPYPKKSINWAAIHKASVMISSKPDYNESEFDPSWLEGMVGSYVFNPVPGTKEFKVDEPLEVLEIGTGYMLIKRAVFSKFKEEYPHLSYRPDSPDKTEFSGSREIHAFFDTVIDPVSKRYLSEDYMFCQYWRAIGGKIWLCPWMETTHVGTYPFKGSMKSIAETTKTL